MKRKLQKNENLLSDLTNLNLPEKKLSNKTLQVKRKNSLPTQNS